MIEISPLPKAQSSAQHALIQGAVYPVVMAGGSGTRFWPLSRRHLPKQFLPIGGERPLIVTTLERLLPVASWSNQYIVAGEQHREGVIAHCPQIPRHQLLVEPCARNTAPCIALAALHIMARDPEGIMIVSPSDHHINDPQSFENALRAAIEGAREGKIVTLGVVPTRPETGYGYLHFPGGGEVNRSRLSVERFVEKPPRSLAEEYLASGEYLWNSGLFIMSARRLLSEVCEQLPDMACSFAPVQEALLNNDHDAYQHALDQAFAEIKPISVDVGIMEGARDVEVIPIRVGWSDVGHWGALEEVYPPDATGSVLRGADHVLIDASRITVSSDKVVAVVGASDLIVVDTPDAVLVCHRDRAQDVKHVVSALNHQGRDQLT